jgi:hypothetical protein
MTDKPAPREREILLYTRPKGDIRVEVLFEEESFWLTQKRMADLFEVTIPTISYHLKEIFGSEELGRDRTIRKFLTVQIEGGREVAREVEFYNLDAIIAVGYRVNSRQATQFRIWATSVLRDFIEERRKATDGSQDLEECTHWQGPQERCHHRQELSERGRDQGPGARRLDVSRHAENQAARHIPMRMADWVSKLDAFLTFNEYEILKDAGRVSHAVAKALAEKEYETFRLEQDRRFESDFEREAKRVAAKAKSKSKRRKPEN